MALLIDLFLFTLVISLYDFRNRRISNWATFPVIIAGLIAHFPGTGTLWAATVFLIALGFVKQTTVQSMLTSFRSVLHLPVSQGYIMGMGAMSRPFTRQNKCSIMPMMNMYNSAQFAKLAGVSVKTVQHWDREGRLKPAARTPGNQRLYTPEQLNQVLNRVSKTKQVTIATLRVSSQAQKPDLSNQKAALEQFCIARGIAGDEWISEIGGGLNFKRPKFSDLVDRIIRSELSTLVIAHKDRLARFGHELVAHLCETHGCQIVVLNTESLCPEQEMMQDLLTIVHCFSSRLSGLRNYRKAIQKAMTNDQGTQDPAQSIG